MNRTAGEQTVGGQGASDTEAPPILSRLEGNVLWLTLNRPERRNPLSSQMIAALEQALVAAGDDPGVRVVVIAAAGPVFSAGHDLREMGARSGESEEQRAARVREILSRCARMMMTIVHSPRAIIASVQGTASAAGCQLVSACDLAVASETAGFGTPGVNIGTFCTTPLVGIGRNVHRKHAMEMALTGELASAEEALRFGLVNRVVPAAQLEQETRALAAKIASKSALAIRNGKETFYRQVDMPLEEAFRLANETMLQGVLSEESREGTRAFLEKREPVWGDA